MTRVGLLLGYIMLLPVNTVNSVGTSRRSKSSTSFISHKIMSKHHKGKGRGRGRPGDSPEVQLSKTLSYILRHGAKGEGLVLRSDGYVKLDDLLRRPKLRGTTFEEIRHVVETNEKKRFTMLLEPASEAGGTAPLDAGHIPVEVPQTSTSASTTSIVIPAPDGTELPESLEALTNEGAVWYIRANQGHTLKVEDLELKAITDPSELPLAIHGTTTQAWQNISRKGLSKMGRNHIHLAAGRPGASGVISGMRTSSQILIYVDTAKALNDGIKFHLSANGVILTEGNEEGFLLKKYFEKVERPDGNAIPDTWKDT